MEDGLHEGLGGEHLAGFQADEFPVLAPGHVHHHVVDVQLRIQPAAGLVQEGGDYQVAAGFQIALPVLSQGESLQFHHGPGVGGPHILHDTGIAAHQRQDGH